MKTVKRFRRDPEFRLACYRGAICIAIVLIALTMPRGCG